jgi:chromosome segregation ATPase
MATQQPTGQPSGSPTLRAIGGFFRFLIRLILVVLVGALIGLGLYTGFPWAYRNLVEPVQQNTRRVEALEERVTQELERLQDEDLAFEERIASLETEITSLREQSAVQAQQIAGAIEDTQELEGRIAQTEADLQAQQRASEAARSELAGAILDVGEQTDQVFGQTENLEGRLALLQTAQDLLKVRLLLLEDNPRSARDTLTLATVHLDQAVLVTPEQAETLLGLKERMVELDALIEDRSFRVGPELESLWADVMDLVLPSAPAEEPTS